MCSASNKYSKREPSPRSSPSCPTLTGHWRCRTVHLKRRPGRKDEQGGSRRVFICRWYMPCTCSSSWHTAGLPPFHVTPVHGGRCRLSAGVVPRSATVLSAKRGATFTAVGAMWVKLPTPREDYREHLASFNLIGPQSSHTCRCHPSGFPGGAWSWHIDTGRQDRASSQARTHLGPKEPMMIQAVGSVPS